MKTPEPKKAALRKASLQAALREVLEGTLATLEAAHAATREGATHEQAKPENDKDTRALEQSYLARGQAMRIEALKAGIAALGVMSLAPSAVARVGSVVDAEDDDGAAVTFFLAPEGGGTRLPGNVQVLTPSAPLGAALVGKRTGDEVELRVGARVRRFTLTAVV